MSYQPIENTPKGSKENVYAAAEYIYSTGAIPTTREITRLNGGGSFSEVNNFLRTWKAEKGMTVIARGRKKVSETLAVADTEKTRMIQETMKMLQDDIATAQAIREESEMVIAEAEKEHALEMEKMALEIEARDAEIARLKTEIAKKDSEIATIENLTKAVQDCTGQIAKLAEKVTKLETTAEAKKPRRNKQESAET